MNTAICANYKPTDTLSASIFMADLPPDYGLGWNAELRGILLVRCGLECGRDCFDHCSQIVVKT